MSRVACRGAEGLQAPPAVAAGLARSNLEGLYRIGKWPIKRHLRTSNLERGVLSPPAAPLRAGGRSAARSGVAHSRHPMLPVGEISYLGAWLRWLGSVTHLRPLAELRERVERHHLQPLVQRALL